jgi:hypothetical protein
MENALGEAGPGIAPAANMAEGRACAHRHTGGKALAVRVMRKKKPGAQFRPQAARPS